MRRTRRRRPASIAGTPSATVRTRGTPPWDPPDATRHDVNDADILEIRQARVEASCSASSSLVGRRVGEGRRARRRFPQQALRDSAERDWGLCEPGRRGCPGAPPCLCAKTSGHDAGSCTSPMRVVRERRAVRIDRARGGRGAATGWRGWRAAGGSARTRSSDTRRPPRAHGPNCRNGLAAWASRGPGDQPGSRPGRHAGPGRQPGIRLSGSRCRIHDGAERAASAPRGLTGRAGLRLAIRSRLATSRS